MMKKLKMWFKKVPSWIVFIGIFGLLYYTGWHRGIITTFQKLVMSTGVLDVDLSKVEKESTSNKYKVGEGFSMRNLDNGEELMFDQFHGKVIFLNLWATWCPPCKAEMPSIQRLYEELNSDDIEFVMLSLDGGGEHKVKNFIVENDYSFPVYLPLQELPIEFKSTGIPATYIISSKGKILFGHTGIANYNTEEMKSFLLELSDK